MSISSAINAAQSGLNASTRRADIVANNVANASTPGYVRRSVSLSETLTGGNTSGVRVSGISRSSNEFLVAERRSIGSDLAKADLLSSVWGDLSRRIGDSPDGPGLFSAMSRFESSLSKAALSPESG
ncbi:MAG: flagellar basal body protein, partial [Pseudomonadota bacterium]